MNARKLGAAAGVIALIVGLFTGCGSTNSASNATSDGDSNSGTTATYSVDGAKDSIRIASGSENKEVSGAIEQAAKQSKVSVTVDYMGSLDVMDALRNKGHHAGRDYDAVWPASSMWITMGDIKHVVKDQVSTSTTPVVFGVKQSKAEELGWANTDGTTKLVSTKDIMDAVKAKKLSFAMTSATQSNSGASAYMAFLTALNGGKSALTKDDLNDASLRKSVKTVLSGVNRSSGSSDWLKDMVVNDPDTNDSMVNYESLVIQADKALTAKNKEPLLAVYPSDGIAISDSPLAYVDPSVLKTITMPSSDIIEQALDQYQTVLRKPAYTLWVVDYSGSMSGKGKSGAVAGLQAALDTDQARASHIEPGDDDVNVFIPFNSSAKVAQVAQGKQTATLLAASENQVANGNADIYNALEVALKNLPSDRDDYTVAIALLTDGQSDTAKLDEFKQQYASDGKGVPIFSIMFGDADSQQLDDLAKLSNGKVFDGRNGNLSGIFREVKGYN